MSRSFKHTPIQGIAGSSEKKDKQILHGKLRTRARVQLSQDPENYLEPSYDEVLDKWSMSKDGKNYFGVPCFSHYLQRWIWDKEDIKKAMRK